MPAPGLPPPARRPLPRPVRWGVLFGLCFVAASCSSGKHSNESVVQAATSAPRDTSTAPEFSLPNLKGETVHLSDFKGKVVILDFWATWCGPCKMEIPHFAELLKRHGAKGFAIVGVAMDEPGAEVVRPFVTKNKIEYHVLLGDTYTANKYGGVNALPTTFLIDRKGKIVRKYIGYRSLESFEEDLAPLFEVEGKPAPAPTATSG